MYWLKDKSDIQARNDFLEGYLVFPSFVWSLIASQLLFVRLWLVMNSGTIKNMQSTSWDTSTVMSSAQPTRMSSRANSDTKSSGERSFSVLMQQRQNAYLRWTDFYTVLPCTVSFPTWTNKMATGYSRQGKEASLIRVINSIQQMSLLLTILSSSTLPSFHASSSMIMQCSARHPSLMTFFNSWMSSSIRASSLFLRLEKAR